MAARQRTVRGIMGGMDFESLVYADRSERGKLRFTGEQRAWFLHQIMTQSFDPISAGEVREAALLTAHGRMVGYLEAVATDDSIFAHYEPELKESFPDAIRRYVFATMVDIDDVSDEMGLVLVAGPGWDAAVRGAAPGAPVQSTSALGTAAGYLWTPRADVPALIDGLQRAGARRASEDELETVRIGNGVARWGRDMNDKTIPMEARIEDVAVHFEKGCYVGQEAMAKIHFRGKVNRLLRRIEASDRIDTGAEVTHDGAKVGRVTSSAGATALAILKYTVEPGTAVAVGEIDAKVVA
jgi:folate-binding protein YgfZ